jgi:hypothetical protein
MTSTFRYGVSILAAFSVCGIANYFNLSRHVTCYDCFFPYGVPFTFFQEGGEGGGRGIVWSGAIGDVLLVAIGGAVLGWVWNRMSRQISN